MVYLDPTLWPVGLLAQLVERCTGIAKVMGSNPVRAWIFQVLFSTTRISSVFSCEDLLISCYDLIAQQMRLNHLDDVFILLHRQILTDNDKNIDFSKQLGHNVVLIPIYWPPGGFVDVDLPWICNSM